MRLDSHASPSYASAGGLGFYKGFSVFLPRVMLASSLQLSCYDSFKASIQRRGHAWPPVVVHSAAALLTGVAVIAVMHPFDVVTTRLMNQRTNKYTGPVGTPFLNQ